MELIVVLVPSGALFGLGAAWVVFKASSERSIWVRSLRVLIVLLVCMSAPVLFFMALGGIARYTQPSSGSAAIRAWLPRPGPAFELVHDGGSNLPILQADA